MGEETHRAVVFMLAGSYLLGMIAGACVCWCAMLYRRMRRRAR